jgi:hypothetical protein
VIPNGEPAWRWRPANIARLLPLFVGTFTDLTQGM